MTNASEGFEYEGYLVFNGLFSTQIDSNSLNTTPREVEGRLTEAVPEFSSGTPVEPGEGYEKIPLRDYFRDHHRVSEEFASLSDRLISYRYKHERFDDEVASVDGNRREVQVPKIKDVDLYWYYPDYLFIRGEKSTVKDSKKMTQSVLQGDVSIKEATFEPDFLLWMFYMYSEDRTLDGNLTIERLTDSEASGRRDFFGRNNEVNKSQNLAQSTPLLLGILKGKNVSMLEGDYEVGGKSVGAKIEEERVHVKASRGSISATSDDTLRMAMTLNFVLELMELHQYWSNLSPNEKYPPFEFFRSIYDECKRQGVKVESISKNALEKYATLRNEDPDEWGL